MTMNPADPRNVSAYVDILDRFIERSLTVAEFEVAFLALMKSERRHLGQPVYPILQGLFEDVDAYVARPELRTGPDDLDDWQLLQSVRRARDAIRDAGFT